jgi:oligoribonuclease
MPTLEAHLHYRMIDVSSVKELAKRWHPEVASGFKKKGEHTALADIRESIEELRFYREHLFRGSSE